MTNPDAKKIAEWKALAVTMKSELWTAKYGASPIGDTGDADPYLMIPEIDLTWYDDGRNWDRMESVFAFIVAAREAVPALIAEVERLSAPPPSDQPAGLIDDMKRAIEFAEYMAQAASNYQTACATPVSSDDERTDVWNRLTSAVYEFRKRKPTADMLARLSRPSGAGAEILAMREACAKIADAMEAEAAMPSEIAAAIRSLPAPSVASGWQTIASAPKDGTHLWVIWPNGIQGEAWFTNDKWAEHEFVDDVSPTHWMPLPPPPATEEGA